MNEAETRAEYIYPALKAAGWGTVAGSRIRREYPITPGRIEGHGKHVKPLSADYVLQYRNTKLAVLEAKAWNAKLTEGVDELDQEKLSPLLKLKYHNSMHDAIADLGKPEEIGQAFAGFQRYLYQVPGAQ